MTKNYNRNKKMRAKLMKEKAKLMKEKAKGLQSHRRCESSNSSAHDNRRQRPRSPRACSGPVAPASTIVVKGLPKEATEEMIHQILAEWRPLPNIRVMPRKNTTLCRGIAFVDFPSEVAARKLMDEIGDRGLNVNGRKLYFDYSVRRLSKVSQFANKDPIVNAGIGESEVAEEHEDPIVSAGIGEPEVAEEQEDPIVNAGIGEPEVAEEQEDPIVNAGIGEPEVAEEHEDPVVNAGIGESEVAEEHEDPIINAGIGQSEVAEEHEDENDSEDDEEDSDYVDEVASKRLPVPWEPEEIHMLREAFHYLVKDGKKKPWKAMLEYGHNVFRAGRTNEDLRSKWKYMVSHGQW